MNDKQEKTADRIFERGALKFGAFRLKLHETNPDAPLSPFYLNLRNPQNPNPGPLLEEDYDLIASCLWEIILEKNLDFSAIAGIPRAGDPIAEAFNRIVPEPRGFKLIPLDKKEEDGKRRIVPQEGFSYEQNMYVLPVDDLVTKGHTKIESIEAIESEGAIVKDLVVLVDREQGGRNDLEAAGYNLYTAFTIRELFDYYHSKQMIDGAKYQESMDYLRNN